MTADQSPLRHPPFVATVFDLSFRRFVTPRLIPILYVLGLLVVALYALAMAGSAASAVRAGGGPGLAVGIAVFVVVFGIGALYARVTAEVAAVAFRVYERVADPAVGPVD